MSKKRNKVANPFKSNKNDIAKMIGDTQYKAIQNQVRVLEFKKEGKKTKYGIATNQGKGEWKVLALFDTEKKAQKVYTKIVMESFVQNNGRIDPLKENVNA